jgi:hypothetical protein
MTAPSGTSVMLSMVAVALATEKHRTTDASVDDIGTRTSAVLVPVPLKVTSGAKPVPSQMFSVPDESASISTVTRYR